MTTGRVPRPRRRHWSPHRRDARALPLFPLPPQPCPVGRRSREVFTAAVYPPAHAVSLVHGVGVGCTRRRGHNGGGRAWGGRRRWPHGGGSPRPGARTRARAVVAAAKDAPDCAAASVAGGLDEPRPAVHTAGMFAAALPARVPSRAGCLSARTRAAPWRSAGLPAGGSAAAGRVGSAAAGSGPVARTAVGVVRCLLVVAVGTASLDGGWRRLGTPTAGLAPPWWVDAAAGAAPLRPGPPPSRHWGTLSSPLPTRYGHAVSRALLVVP